MPRTKNATEPVSVVTDPSLPTVELPVAAVSSKPWYTSKTIWLQVAALAGTVLKIVSEERYPTPEEMSVIGLLVSNIGLRFVTDKPVK